MDRTWEQPWPFQGCQVCFQGTQPFPYSPRNRSTNLRCQRLPDQPPIPEQTDEEVAENEGANGDMAEGRSEPETLPADENGDQSDG